MLNGPAFDPASIQPQVLELHEPVHYFKPINTSAVMFPTPDRGSLERRNALKRSRGGNEPHLFSHLAQRRFAFHQVASP
jgi:hypothetical protein